MPGIESNFIAGRVINQSCVAGFILVCGSSGVFVFSGGVELSCKSFGFASSPGQWGMEEAKRWSVDVFLPRENCAVGHKELF